MGDSKYAPREQPLTFDGSINVRSTPHGYAVLFEAQTNAHDLGHVLGAIITSYLDKLCQQSPLTNAEHVRDLVIEGIHCGLKHNPKPLGTVQ